MRKILACAALAWSAAALAQTDPAPADTTKIGPIGDPNQILCRRENVLGSRVATRRVCRTRAEWAEHRLQFRQNVERAQNQNQTHTE